MIVYFVGIGVLWSDDNRVNANSLRYLYIQREVRDLTMTMTTILYRQLITNIHVIILYIATTKKHQNGERGIGKFYPSLAKYRT